MGRAKRELITKEINGKLVDGVICSRCREWKPLDSYGKDKTRSYGVKPRCKPCESANSSEYKRRNTSKVKSYNRSYYENHKEELMEAQKLKRRENPAKYNLYKQIRRARVSELPNDMSTTDIEYMKSYFGDSCALSGSPDYSLDHFIAVSTGFGGTTVSNILPLSHELNASKNDKNPFEWFSENKERFNLDEERFVDAVNYLAELNGMTFEDYREYVYRCYDCELLPVSNL